MVSNSKRKFQSQWILSSYNSDVELYPDSLDHENEVEEAQVEEEEAPTSSIQLPPTISITSNSSIHNFQTANNFLWTVSKNSEYYDSIDSNNDVEIDDDGVNVDDINIDSHFDYGLYRQKHGAGEDLAEYDSLEKRITDVTSLKKI